MSIFTMPTLVSSDSPPATARTKAGRWALVLVVLIPLTASEEGFASRPYVDRVGTGHPETWCYGETKADGPEPPYSKIFTKAECQALLGKSEVKYNEYVHKYITVPMPVKREAALTDFALNLGPGAVKQIAHYFNSGNPTAGCHAMLAYDHGNGVVLEGLEKRRAREQALCNAPVSDENPLP